MNSSFSSAIFFFAIFLFVNWRFRVANQTTTDQGPSTLGVKASTRVKTLGWARVISGGLAALLLVSSSFAMVGTKDVGVVTAFGKTNGELSSGLHFVYPWETVTSLDAAIQTDNHTGSTCVDVRIANQQTACVDISIRWRIRPSQSDQLYQNYHSFTNIQDSLVTRELTAAVNNQLADYNPLNSVNLVTPASGQTPNPSLSVIAGRITTQMRSEIGSQIEVLNTIVPIITFDHETQNRINQLQQQIALTRIAEQQILTNEAQAKANNALAQSVNSNPGVLEAQCLNLMATMVKAGMTPPIGMNCLPGTSAVGGVIVNGAPKK